MRVGPRCRSRNAPFGKLRSNSVCTSPRAMSSDSRQARAEAYRGNDHEEATREVFSLPDRIHLGGIGREMEDRDSQLPERTPVPILGIAKARSEPQRQNADRAATRSDQSRVSGATAKRNIQTHAEVCAHRKSQFPERSPPATLCVGNGERRSIWRACGTAAAGTRRHGNSERAFASRQATEQSTGPWAYPHSKVDVMATLSDRHRPWFVILTGSPRS